MVDGDILDILVMFMQLLPPVFSRWFETGFLPFEALWRKNLRRRRNRTRRSKTFTYIPLNKVFMSKVAAAHWCKDNMYIVHRDTFRGFDVNI